MANRRTLQKAIEAVQAGGTAPGVADSSLAAQMTGPDTVDGFAPAASWEAWWQAQADAKRAAAAWARTA
jgi:phthalate 4,5-dioxygenase